MRSRKSKKKNHQYGDTYGHQMALSTLRKTTWKPADPLCPLSCFLFPEKEKPLWLDPRIAKFPTCVITGLNLRRKNKSCVFSSGPCAVWMLFRIWFGLYWTKVYCCDHRLSIQFNTAATSLTDLIQNYHCKKKTSLLVFHFRWYSCSVGFHKEHHCARIENLLFCNETTVLFYSRTALLRILIWTAHCTCATSVYPHQKR